MQMQLYKLKKSIVFTGAASFLGAAFLTGCGDSSSYSTTQEIIPLAQGQEVLVNSGDKIQPMNEETQIEVRHLLDADKKYVTLLRGSADLVRGNYEIE